jgi:phosphoglycerate kinase
MTNIDSYDFEGKKVLIRVDFNVPLDDDFNVTDDTKIRASLQTLRKILSDGGSPIVMSHLGRPKGKEDRFSLRHVQQTVSDLLDAPVKMARDCIGSSVKNIAEALQSGEVLLLENTRFYDEEKMGDEDFAKQLAELGDVYVNDAFATAHRAHASTTIIANQFPAEHKMFGYLMAAEIDNAEKTLNSEDKPFTVILGGAKVSDKILLIEQLMEKADNILIGGAMAYTFFRAMGGETGNSMTEEDKIDVAKSIIDKAKAVGVNLIIPLDSVNASEFSNDAAINNSDVPNVPDGFMGLDIGPKTIEAYTDAILSAKKILWNGTMGVYEMSNFAQGTQKIGDLVAEATRNGAYSLIGGGDTVAAIKKLGLRNHMSYSSTGGGALLTYFEGKELPGITAIAGKVHSS